MDTETTATGRRVGYARVSTAVVWATAFDRQCHHEAGHAVAVAARGGTITRIVVVDPATAADTDVGYVLHRTAARHQSFVTFAGPWAEASWSVLHDPDQGGQFDAALDLAWGNNSDGDGARYAAVVDRLVDAAAALGLPAVGRAWEGDWCGELEDLWPAIRAVATQLAAGTAVDHAAVVAALAETDAA
ncbi:MAG: hypothetical protein WBO08_18705 [Mycobacterium sp.]